MSEHMSFRLHILFTERKMEADIYVLKPTAIAKKNKKKKRQLLDGLPREFQSYVIKKKCPCAAFVLVKS